MHTYPYTLAGVGSGFALCLNRGVPGPAGQPYGLVGESTIHPDPVRQRAARFILGNIPENPNYDFNDPEFQRSRRVLREGFQLVAAGELSTSLFDNFGNPAPPAAIDLDEIAFHGPYNGWDVYGIAQVALWFVMGQFPQGGCFRFLSGGGGPLDLPNRSRLYNAYTIFRTLAIAWANGTITCESLDGCDPTNLRIEAPSGTSFAFETTGVPPDCNRRQVVVGPFSFSDCCNTWPNPSLDAPGGAAVFTSDAGGTNVITPGCGGSFFVRLTPPSNNYTFRIRGRVDVESSEVFYFRHAGSPVTGEPLRQNMGLSHRTAQRVNTEISVNVTFTCDDEPQPDPEPEPCPRPPHHIFIPPPPRLPILRPPTTSVDNNNNNNNSSNNSSSNNNSSMQSTLVNVLLNQAQNNLLMAILRRNWQNAAPPPGGPWPWPPPWVPPPGPIPPCGPGPPCCSPCPPCPPSCCPPPCSSPCDWWMRPC